MDMEASCSRGSGWCWIHRFVQCHEQTSGIYHQNQCHQGVSDHVCSKQKGSNIWRECFMFFPLKKSMSILLLEIMKAFGQGAHHLSVYVVHLLTTMIRHLRGRPLTLEQTPFSPCCPAASVLEIFPLGKAACSSHTACGYPLKLIP